MMTQVVPVWNLYSWWVFGLTLLWSMGVLNFSPLLSALCTLAGSIIIFKTRKNFINFLIFLSHLVPVYVLRHAPFDPVQNILTFFLYLIFLEENGTSFVRVYDRVITDPPRSVTDYLVRRGLITETKF